MIHSQRERTQPLALVVDDDPTLRLTMEAALKKIGIAVADAETGQQGIACFDEQAPDIILLDVMLPDIDGFQVCREIRSRSEGHSVQILMVTGLEDVASIQEAFDAGANGFTSKPLNLTTLGHQVQYMLRAGKAFKELHISKSRLAKTQELARIGHWQINLKNNAFFCSLEASRLLALNITGSGEYDSDSAPIVSFEEFFSTIIHKDRARIREIVENMIHAGETETIEYIINKPDGSSRHILNTSEILYDEQEQPVLLLGIVQDVSPLKQAEEEIRYLAFYDSLTGLANRMLFMDRLNLTIREAIRRKKRFALLFLDLDHFKRINDTLGHQMGDLLLQEVTKNIKKSIRATDSASRMPSQPDDDALIARLGGDEFCVLITDIKNPESAALVARRLLENIPVIYNLDDHEVSITTSIGISVFPEDGREADELLKHADTAMYHAKNQGRNTYQFFMDSMNLAAMERFSIDRDLKNAIKRDELVLYYQPKLRLSDRKITGAEALIRWLHPQKGMIPPDRFIPIAEESDLIIDINRWVVKEACRQTSKWKQNRNEDFTIAVNLSGYRLNSQNIVESLRETLEDHKLDASHIELEITENILMHDTRATIATLNSIKGMNFRIAMDDFGTGYSSLSYLTSFPVDTLKIDRSFVMGSLAKQSNHVIIKAIIAMGHSLGKNIIAEGIETEEQYQGLKDLGCDDGQGYFFHHPVPADEFEKLLATGYL
ncbi:MAG: EAL domain-containing protein [Desulfobacteraceae bacterium]|nr:MAG: EAL domain-containing protein [Desulfobacteraceae bacterium]